MTDETGELTDTLEPVAYLSRSENRLQVLEALTEPRAQPWQETPGCDPRELREVTDASEATVSRILSEFQERGWTERNRKGEYVPTPQATHLANEFRPLIDSLDTIQTLGDVSAFIPVDELTIGLHNFRDATVIRYGPSDQGIAEPLTNMVQSSTTLHILTWYTPPIDLGIAMENGVESRGLEGEMVVADSLLDSIATNPEGPPDWEVYIDSEKRPLYLYDGYLPCNLFISEDAVLIENGQVDDIPIGTWLKSQNEAVREWALEVLERYRDKSEEINLNDLIEG